MILLTSTSDVLRLLTGSAVSTDFHTSFVDITAASFDPSSTEGNTAAAGNSTLADAPAAGVKRQIKAIAIVNRDGVSAQTVTVQKQTGAGTFSLTPNVTLLAGESLQYIDTEGFTVLNAAGQIKTVGSTGATGATGSQGPVGVTVYVEDGSFGEDGVPGPAGPAGVAGAPAQPGAAAYGEMSIVANATATTLTTINTFYQITAGWAQNALNGFTFASGALTAAYNGPYLTTAAISLQSASTANMILNIQLYKNGTAVAGHNSYAKLTNTADVNSVAFTGVIDSVVAGDVFDLRIQCTSNSAVTVVVSYANLSITAIQGARGSSGAQGTDGVDGDDGPPGPPGSPGLAGTTGASGPQGVATFLEAEQAMDGEPGPPGQPGVAGAAGTTGAQGPQGPAVFLDADQGEQGDNGLPGSTGPAGPTGPQGIQGLQGVAVFVEDGLTGDDGAPGPAGVAGAIGTTGAQGPQGPAVFLDADPGEQGEFGLPGAAGAQGPQGVQGIQGLVGVSVFVDDGLQGDDGAPGPAGATGGAGTTGAQGPQGVATFLAPDDGNDGDPGPPGQTGAAGTAGTPGGTGAQGPTGPAVFLEADQGDDGDRGPPGPQGSATDCIVITLDGAGAVIPTGDTKTYFVCPFAGFITAWYLTGDPSGSIVIDVWKVAGAIPTVANTIAGSELPTLVAAALSNDTALTTWTTAVAEGDVFGFAVNSASTVTKAVLTIKITKS
jgi:hypothetical protein